MSNRQSPEENILKIGPYAIPLRGTFASVMERVEDLVTSKKFGPENWVEVTGSWASPGVPGDAQKLYSAAANVLTKACADHPGKYLG